MIHTAFFSIRGLHFLNLAFSEDVLGFFPLKLFTEQLFEMVLVETIQIYPNRHVT